MNQVFHLIKKEFLLEWRSLHTLVSILLYIACTVFALYMMVGQPEALIWNALFWVSQLFIIVNAVAKSFIQEGSVRQRYYYSIVAPWQFILSKLIYNMLFIMVLAILTLLTFILLLGNVINEPILYFSIAILGTAALSVLFTFLTAIAAQAQQGAAMTAILGFPLAIPMILILSKLSTAAVAQVVQEGNWHLIGLVGLLLLIMLLLSIILFPFLWGES